MMTKERRLTDYNRLKHEESVVRKNAIFDIASRGICSLSMHDLMLIGVAVYWAEGYKTDLARDVEIVNSDPLMIKLMMKWFREICGVPEAKFRVRIQIHNAADIEKGTRYWSSITGVPLQQFTKSYIKVSPSSKRITGNRHPYGICHIRIADTGLLTKIKGWINGLSGAIV